MKPILPSSRISRRAVLSTLLALATLPSLLLFTAAQAQTVTTHRENPKFVLPQARIPTFDQQILI
jgi:hypothetical protein